MSTNADRARRWYKEVWKEKGEPTVHELMADTLEGYMACWHVTATHKGASLGFPATNKRVAFRGMTWLEFRDGQIVRGWDSWNLGGLLQSLGAPGA